MQRSFLSFLSILVLACALPALAFQSDPAAQSPPLSSSAVPDWAAVTGPYPALGTFEAMEELAIVAWLERTRTSADVARAKAESTPSLGCFYEVLPGGTAPGVSIESFDLKAFPKTTAVLAAARADLVPIIQGLRAQFARPRPYVSFPNLQPALPKEASFGYPSKHSAMGEVYGRIIAQFAPTDRTFINERGLLLGNDRVMAGVHWPSDVEAGQRLGRAFATYWISQPENRLMIQEACAAEWHGAVGH